MKFAEFNEIVPSEVEEEEEEDGSAEHISALSMGEGAI